MTMGEIARARRVELGLTQQEVADRLGVKQPTVAAFERGGVSPNLESLRRYADALNCDLEVTMRPKATLLDPVETVLNSR
jgi:transcriptional regulator with XRE-family HTH domain